MLNDAEIILK